MAHSPKTEPDARLLADLRALAALPDDKIDLTDPDAPEVADWSDAVRGKYFRPIKRQKTLRIDADVLAYFEAFGRGYQTRMNEALREAMTRGLQRRAARPRQEA